jgi:hypothetical protein
MRRVARLLLATRVVAFLAGVVLLAACGASGHLSAAASQTLRAQVAAVRGAAAAHDSATAQRGLDQLRSTLTQLEGTGQISASRASAILIDVSAVQAQLTELPTTTTPTTSTTTTTAPPAPAHHGKDHGGGGDGGGG